MNRPDPIVPAAEAGPADTGIRRGPRDAREAAFVHALTASTDTPQARMIAKAGRLFLLGAAGFVVAAAVIARIAG